MSILDERRFVRAESKWLDRGSGDRERDVERELAPERGGRTGI